MKKPHNFYFSIQSHRNTLIAERSKNCTRGPYSISMKEVSSYAISSYALAPWVLCFKLWIICLSLKKTYPQNFANILNQFTWKILCYRWRWGVQPWLGELLLCTTSIASRIAASMAPKVALWLSRPHKPHSASWTLYCTYYLDRF